MTRLTVATLTTVLLVTSTSIASSQAGAARQENAPGQPTLAKMLVTNKDRTEAIPVTIFGATQVLPVEITGAPIVVGLAPTAVAGSRAVRQNWEYRQVAVPNGGDLAGMLNAAGADGWEAVGAAPAGANSSLWLLKRPR